MFHYTRYDRTFITLSDKNAMSLPFPPFPPVPPKLPNNLISILLLFYFKLTLNHPQICVGILVASKRDNTSATNKYTYDAGSITQCPYYWKNLGF